MYKQISFNEFCDTFRNVDRNENFTYNGKKALFDHLEDYEEQLGETYEFDCIAICCTYTEYPNLKAIKGNYLELDGNPNYSIQDLRDRTGVIIFEDGIILENF